jgi:hypothetical protein
MKLTKEQIEANEQFFLKMLKLLNDGGIYVFPEANAVFKKHYGVFYAMNPPNLDSIKDLVSEDFKKQYFRVLVNPQNN